MKLSLSFLLLFLLNILFAQSQTYNLTVTITNLTNTKGQVEVGLYRTPSNFAKVGLTYLKIRTKFTGNQVMMMFKNLAVDDY